MAKYDQWLTEDGLFLLRGWSRDGLTDAQIAHNCGVNRDTLYQWRKRFPVIADTLKAGKEVADLRVTDALYRRAIGYTFDEVTEDRDAAGNLTGSRIVQKVCHPDVTACIYWLKNRRREEWKDSHDRYEIEKERLELEKQKVEAELHPEEKDNTITIIMSDEVRELAQ